MGWKKAAVIGALVMAGLLVWWATGFKDMRGTLDPGTDRGSAPIPGSSGASLEGQGGVPSGGQGTASRPRGPTRDLRVRVAGADGKGVAGAELRVGARGTADVSGRRPVDALRHAHDVFSALVVEPFFTGRTDDQGVAILSDVPMGGGAVVQVTPPAPWAATTHDVPHRVPEEGVWEIRVRRGAALAMRVEGASGPVSVSLYAQTGPFAHQDAVGLGPRMTDEQGALSWDAVPGAWVTATIRRGGDGAEWRATSPLPRDAVWRIPAPTAEGTHVMGQIVDETGAPVGGAWVSIETLADAGNMGASTRRLVQADDQGHYSARNLLGETLRQIQASAPGHVLRRRTEGRALVKGAVNTVDVILPRGRSVRGRVIGPDARGIAGVKVSWFPYGRQALDLRSFQRTSTQTDAEGRFELVDVIVPAISLVLVGPAWAVSDLEALRGLSTQAWGDRERTFHMVPGGCVHGRVLDTHGRGVPHAHVEVGERMPGSPSGLAGWAGAVACDPDGRFRFDTIRRRGPALLRARTATHISELVRVEVADPGTDEPVELTLHPLARIHGTISHDDGSPAAGRRIRLELGEQHVSPVRTCTQGRYEIVGLLPGRGRLVVGPETGMTAWTTRGDAPPQAEVEVDVPGVSVQVDLSVPRRHRLQGILQDTDGHPVSGAHLMCQSTEEPTALRMIPTGLGGEWAITNLPTGTYEFHHQHRSLGRFEAGTLDVVLVTSDGAGTASLASAMWTLRVLDAEGRRVPRATVRVHDADAGGARRAQGHVRDGLVTLTMTGQTVTGGPVRVTVDDAKDLAGRRLDAGILDAMLAWEPGGEAVVTLPAGARVEGRVLDEEGEPVAGLTLDLAWTPAPRRGPRVPSTQTGPDGRFSFLGLPKGAGSLTALTSGRFLPMAPIPVASGGDPVAITVRRGATIEGRVHSQDGPIGIGTAVQFHGDAVRGSGGQPLRVFSMVDSEGGFVIRGLPAHARGRVQVLAPRADGDGTWPAAQVLDVPAGARGLTLHILSEAWISGRVRFAEGQAPPNDVRGMAVGVGDNRGVLVQFTVAADGTFRVGPMMPGPMQLLLMLSAPWPRQPPVGVQAPQENVRIDVGRGVTLRGRIEDGIGTSTIVQWGPAGSGIFQPFAQAMASEDGTFLIQIHGAVPGRIHAFDTRRGLVALLEDVHVGETPVVVRLQAGLEISGTLDAPTSRVPATIQVIGPVRRAGSVATDGTWFVRGLPPGSYAVEVHRSMQRASHPPVPAGTKDVHLKLR